MFDPLNLTSLVTLGLGTVIDKILLEEPNDISPGEVNL